MKGKKHKEQAGVCVLVNDAVPSFEPEHWGASLLIYLIELGKWTHVVVCEKKSGLCCIRNAPLAKKELHETM